MDIDNNVVTEGEGEVEEGIRGVSGNGKNTMKNMITGAIDTMRKINLKTLLRKTIT